MGRGTEENAMVKIRNKSKKDKMVNGSILFPGHTCQVNERVAQLLIQTAPDDFELVGERIATTAPVATENATQNELMPTPKKPRKRGAKK